MSKSIIIDGANQHLQAERELLLDALPRLEALIAERDDLLARLNAARQTMDSPRVLSDSFQRLFAIREYVFGTFPLGFHSTSGDDAETNLMDRNSADSREETSRTADAGIADLSPSTNFANSGDDIVQLSTYIPPLLYLERTASQPISIVEGPIIANPLYASSSNMQATAPQPPRPLDLARRVNSLPGPHPSLSPDANHDPSLPPHAMPSYSAATSPYPTTPFIPQNLPYYAVSPALPPALPPALHAAAYPPQWIPGARQSLPNPDVVSVQDVNTAS